MTEQTRRSLFEKNTRIIEAVKARAAAVCPGALDMIAVTGSFATGDYHEKSDLDLLIVIGDESGYALSHCFILDDIGYDLYCHTWERLEHAASYGSPYVSKLLDAQIVYCREDAVSERFHALSEKLRAYLEGPLTENDIRHAQEFLNTAKQAYFDMASGGEASYHFPMMNVVYSLECAVYLLNHALVRHGVRGICTELTAMPSLPVGFLDLHTSLFEAHSFDCHMRDSMALIRSTEQWIYEKREAVCPKKEPCADNLRGCYEELFSNYRNKLIQAAEKDNRYLSRMTLASAELFFEEVKQAVSVNEPQRLDSSAYRDPRSARDAFHHMMQSMASVYESVGLPICHYQTASAFEDAYIRAKTE